MSAAERPFEIFGDKANFALEVRHTPDSVVGEEPEDWRGSWGEWRLWISDLNLCELRLDTANGLVEIEEVRWFLAPFFKWVADKWMPLLHEKRLPPGGASETAGRVRHERRIFQCSKAPVMTLSGSLRGSAGRTDIRCAPRPKAVSCPMFLCSAWKMIWSSLGATAFNRAPAPRPSWWKTEWQGFPWTLWQDPFVQQWSGFSNDSKRTQHYG